MNFIDKQIKPSVKVVTLDTNDNVEAVSQLPKTMIKVLNIKDMPKQDGKFVKRITFTRYSNISYNELVNKLIAEKYTIEDELAIHRKYKKGVNEDEFNEFDAYVEECKVKAKEWINQREGK